MKNRVICTTSPNSLGNTFLVWSLYYLSGHKYNVYLDKSNNISQELLTDNPLIMQQQDVGNAHNHKKIYTKGSTHTKNVLAKLKSQENKNLLTCIYAGPMSLPEVSENYFNKSIMDDSFQDRSNTQKLFDLVADDYPEIFKVCKQESVPLVYVTDNMWNCSYKPRSGASVNKQGKLYEESSLSTIILNQIDWDFPGSKEFFSDNLWDIREYLAIHYRPKSNPRFDIDFTLPHYFVEANSLWTDGEHALKCIMNWLDLPIDDKRFNQWTVVYKQWQQMQLARLRLPQNIDFVCNAIVNGWDHNLNQYKLDLFDEAYIQHMLIYKHKVTLKNWQLEKFPGNTKDLTTLVEPVFYNDLENLYEI